MALKLYYGGFGDYFEFCVAESEQEAIERIGAKICAPYLPITAKAIEDVDGFPVVIGGEKAETPVVSEDTEEKAEETTLRHCKKCDFTCETQGQLLAHYREAHPKGE